MSVAKNLGIERIVNPLSEKPSDCECSLNVKTKDTVVNCFIALIKFLDINLHKAQRQSLSIQISITRSFDSITRVKKMSSLFLFSSE